jgi:hypothetical protein
MMFMVANFLKRWQPFIALYPAFYLTWYSKK